MFTSCLLTEKAAKLTHFTDSMVQQPKIQDLIKRVRKFVTEEVGTRGTQYPGAIITVNLKNGRRYSHKVGNRKGTPANPLTADEIKNKFIECARLVHSRNQIDRIVDTVMDLEQLDSVSKLTTMLKTSHL